MRQLSELLVVRRAFLTCLGALLLIFTGATLTAGQELIHEDGRINQVAHFGGDAFYCVDDGFNSTTNYPEMVDGGGFRLLNIGGQELWFVPAADILAAVEESVATNSGVLVAEGQGTYGPARLYTYFDGKEQQFVFSGYDEFGKSNSLTFVPCTPVGPIPNSPSSKTEKLCTLVNGPIGVQGPTGPASKQLAPVMGALPTQSIPCDSCPPLPLGKLLAGKRLGALALIPDPYCEEDLPI